MTKPETGTTSYTYNSDGTVKDVVDAKNQKTEFTYDSLKRLKTVRRHIWNGTSHVHQPCEDVDYTYDTLSGGGSNLWGRLAQVTSRFCNDAVFGGYRERYSYRSSGEMTWRNSDWLNTSGSPLGATLRVEAAYNVMGQMTTYGFGWPGSKMYSYSIGYDTFLRPVNLSGESLALVSLVNYNAAGAVTSFTRQDTQAGAVTNTYDFNSLYQMTGQTVMRGSTTLQELKYAYSEDENNGQMLSQTDALSAETVLYQYL